MIEWKFPVGCWKEQEDRSFLHVCPEGSVKSLGQYHRAIHLIDLSRSLSSSEHVHDEVVHLSEHHKVNGQTGAAVLGGRVAC